MLIMSKCSTARFMLLLFAFIVSINSLASAEVISHTFIIRRTNVTRLCENHTIVTVNDQLPGPTLFARNGDTLNVTVTNLAQYNVSIHWHGIRQIRNSWADGPGYITQCPIQPGGIFTYTFTIVDQEGTLWWHAHVAWLRATVYGAIVIHPKQDSSYPFPVPHAEIPLVLGN